ncbi:MAG: isoprenylcysteine carboxylmethyltransferase family protein [Alphaproteobacteria bacterium]|nr:isoprenylcysteine carboxylmethyltransferase family protein [Alphaproteobacteria bacterium]
MTTRTFIDIQHVQRIRRIGLIMCAVPGLAAMTVMVPYWPIDGNLHHALEVTGLIMIAICIVGRTWSSLYIGGRKKSELVTIGPYSIMRNPLYTFTFVGVAGGGLQFGSFLLPFIVLAVAMIAFRLVVRQEEAFLRNEFGEPYDQYLQRVPRFIPNISLWHSPEHILISPRIVWRTFRDGLAFLLIIPFVEIFEHVIQSGLLPALFKIY